ncbi:hypothetical protein CHS0354_006528 [Potamilus streckersoni]|uniref:Uncharacterized protein n=1 Tax=Potamilus streckersoni TaxID=2493646 RepID=A0AAE0WC45_9BIVA|nr:hypothetical protein CHS0354_006528 [Potamilus streckersoni]
MWNDGTQNDLTLSAIFCHTIAFKRRREATPKTLAIKDTRKQKDAFENNNGFDEKENRNIAGKKTRPGLCDLKVKSINLSNNNCFPLQPSAGSRMWNMPVCHNGKADTRAAVVKWMTCQTPI